VSRDRDDRFEREPRVRLPSSDAWDPFVSTLTEEKETRGEESDDDRMARAQLAFEDRYEVLRTLATGSMAEIRLCKDRPFAREVAMKVLRSGPASRASRWRFFREAASRASSRTRPSSRSTTWGSIRRATCTSR